VIGQYCKKGKPLFVEGRLKYDQWDDKTSGARRSKVSVVVENFQFVGGPTDAGDPRAAPARQATFDDVREPANTPPVARGGAAGGKRAPAGKSVGEGEKRHFTEADIPF
jgi:single-strand DNA-binding protein